MIHICRYNKVQASDRNGTVLPWMDAHDGPIIRHNGTYYWYAMQYTDCTPNFAVRGSPLALELEVLNKLGSDSPAASGFSCGTIMLPTSRQTKEGRCGFLSAKELQFPVF